MREVAAGAQMKRGPLRARVGSSILASLASVNRRRALLLRRSCGGSGGCWGTRGRGGGGQLVLRGLGTGVDVGLHHFLDLSALLGRAGLIVGLALLDHD